MGDQLAARALLEEHLPRVYRFALRMTRDGHQAEDVVQETMLRAWRHRRRLRAAGAARVWLFQIAANVWRDRLRRDQRQAQTTGPAEEIADTSASRPDCELSNQEDARRAVSAMDSLPPRQREVLYLYACEELSFRQIAQVLGITTDAAKASLSLARKQMRVLLKEMFRDRFGQG
jgi:RNA polymerase sigma-70 factor (ECF subfamily)